MKREVFGDYQLIDQISESQKSYVYRAKCLKDQKAVVLKIFKREFHSDFLIARTRQEIQLVQNLDIDGIISVDGMIQVDSEIAVILEDKSGISLREYLKSHDVSVEVFFSIAIQLTDTLAKIHKKNIIHRDIKPHNIIVSLKNYSIDRCFITDFGISGVFQDESLDIYNRQTIEGSLPYISPEQTGRMNLSVDYRSDIYSLGITFYEILTKTVPFVSLDPLELIHSHIAVEPTAINDLRADIPYKLNQLILKMLNKSPENRYQSANGLKFELESLQEIFLAKKDISNFVIGSLDFSYKFVYPQKIFGRDTQIKKLISSYINVCEGRKELMLVSGSPGIGKSRVIQEIQKSIVGSRGYFITGKYEILRKDVPFSSIIQAFQDLIRQILTESEEKQQERKKTLLSHLNTNAQVIIDLIPELEILLGKQATLTDLSPEETQNRFYHSFNLFVKALANMHSPIVLFLDDLQWADQPSLDLLKNIINDKTIQYLFPIFAYRDNETRAAHPFQILVSDLRKNNLNISEIHLEPLGITHVKALVEHLTGGRQESDEIAKIAFLKTGGNPFFLNQFLKSLYDDRIVIFEMGLGWKWDFDRMRKLSVTENVIDLMASKIIKLSLEAQNMLKLCACIGNRFSLEFLAEIMGYEFEKTFQIVRETIDEGLITPILSSYRTIRMEDGLVCKFYHDRIHEAAYSLLDEDEKVNYHARIGYHYLTQIQNDPNSNKIYYVTDQLNEASTIIKDFEKIKKLAELNFRSGIKALDSGAHQPAYKYFKNSYELLRTFSDIWKLEYNLIFSILLKAQETSYLCSDYIETERYNQLLLKNCKLVNDKVKIYEIMIKTCMAKHDLDNAIKQGLAILKKLHIYFPRKPNALHALFSLIKVKFRIYFMKDKIEDLAILEDERIESSIRILSALNSAAYWHQPALLPLLILKVVRLSLRYGNNIHSPYNYTGLGLIYASLEMYDASFEIGITALKISDNPFYNKTRPRTQFVFYTFISPWKNSIRTSIHKLSEIYKNAMLVGDIEFASHTALVAGYYTVLSGIELSEAEIEVNKYTNFSNDLVQTTDLKLLKLYRQIISFLTGEEQFTSSMQGVYFDEANYLTSFEDLNDRTSLFHYYLTNMSINYLLGNFSLALEFGDLNLKTLDGGLAVFAVMNTYFFDSLNRIELLRSNVYKNCKKKYLKQIQINLKKINKAAISAPSNYLGKKYLVEAEIASLQNNFQKAVFLYEEATKVLKENLFLQDYALALELAGKFYARNNLKKSSNTYLIQARKAWSLWGASAIVKNFDLKYPNLNDNYQKSVSISDDTSVSQSLVSNIDYSTIMKFSHLISSEIDFNVLVERILSMAMENAGAQKGALILELNGELSVIASGKTKSKMLRKDPILINDSDEIPISVINYVWSTKENVILTEADQEGIFIRDHYVQKNQVKSVLCVPIIYKKKVSGILYLENNLTSNAFPKERVEMLSMLSSQAAISIDNALLVSQKEDSAKIAKEMEITAEIQLSLIPRKPTSNGYMISSYMKPAESVGGDYFDLINHPDGDWFLIGDVSGHGILSGLIMMMVQTSIQMVRSELKNHTPSSLILKLIEGVEDNFKKIAGKEFKYMTITIFKVLPTGEVLYSGQHQDLLIFRKRTDSVERIQTEGIWIGMGGMTSNPEKYLMDKEFILESGDVLLIYTDGITEGVDTYQSALGVDGLSEILKNSNKSSPESIKEDILTATKLYNCNDDITFMIIQKE
ncbi:MAG: AAA family ATPase [Leptospiraceae bacterium]|nr:AAA family ATPase [Leptospiraceae bacterium]